MSKVIDILRLNECSWCSHLQECQAKNANPDLCGTNLHSHTNDHGVWWGKKVRKISSFEKCQTDDFVPGITLLKYYTSPNFAYPDEVTITNVSQAVFRPVNPQG